MSFYKIQLHSTGSNMTPNQIIILFCPFLYSTRGGAKVCENPPSRLDTCIDNTKLVFQFQACPDVPGSERTGKQMLFIDTCLMWKKYDQQPKFKCHISLSNIVFEFKNFFFFSDQILAISNFFPFFNTYRYMFLHMSPTRTS